MLIDTLHLRDKDLDALSMALDLDAEQLVAEIQAVLGATPDGELTVTEDGLGLIEQAHTGYR